MPADRTTAADPQQQLAQAEAYLQTSVAPQAGAIDRDARALKAALQGLGDRELLALRVPPSWGGAGFDATAFWQFGAMVARHSGALAFLQAQHQSAAAAIAGSSNESLSMRTCRAWLGARRCWGLGFRTCDARASP